MFNLVFKIPGSSKIMARHGARTSCRARRRVKSIENRMGRKLLNMLDLQMFLKKTPKETRTAAVDKIRDKTENKIASPPPSS